MIDENGKPTMYKMSNIHNLDFLILYIVNNFTNRKDLILWQKHKLKIWQMINL